MSFLLCTKYHYMHEETAVPSTTRPEQEVPAVLGETDKFGGKSNSEDLALMGTCASHVTRYVHDRRILNDVTPCHRHLQIRCRPSREEKLTVIANMLGFRRPAALSRTAAVVLIHCPLIRLCLFTSCAFVILPRGFLSRCFRIRKSNRPSSSPADPTCPGTLQLLSAPSSSSPARRDEQHKLTSVW